MDKKNQVKDKPKVSDLSKRKIRMPLTEGERMLGCEVQEEGQCETGEA